MLSTNAWAIALMGLAALGWAVAASAQNAPSDASPSAAAEPAASIDVYEPDVALADLAAGGELYQSVCRNCHGPTAKGMASFPKLAGHDAQYLSIQLAEYRAGQTLGYNTAIMAPHAKELSDQDILNLAAYIATEFE